MRLSGAARQPVPVPAPGADGAALAIAAATSQAGEWAKASNRQLGEISAIQEQYAGYGPQTIQAGGGGMGGGGGVPTIQAGQGETVVVVTVSYALN